MRYPLASLVAGASIALAACGTPTRPAGWGAPEVVVAPSSFNAIHGLAIDAKGRLLAGSLLGSSIWEVDRATGAARVFIGYPDDEADDIAIGPNGEIAWTSTLVGMVRIRDHDNAPVRIIAKDLPGANSIDFDRRNGKLYVSQVFSGDAVWELDPAGIKAPRQIAKDLGGFNGFEVGPDGMLYGPLFFKNSVVRIDPASGTISVINGEFKTPAAANLDGKGNLYVVDAFTGELVRVDLASGRRASAIQLKPGLDNLVIAPDGTIYVSNYVDNSIEAIDPGSGALRVLTSGKLSVPAGIKLTGNTLWVADVFSFRTVDVRTGVVTDVARMFSSDLQFPFSVGVSSKQVALSSRWTGTVQLLDRETRKTQAMLRGWKAFPYDAMPLEDGSLLVAEPFTDTIVHASGPDHANRRVLATGIGRPVQMVLGHDGALYVTGAIGSKLTRVDMSDGKKTELASDLKWPTGLAQTPWGSLIVAEGGERRLTEIDLGSGQRRTVADDLPIGLPSVPGTGYIVTGIAVGADGTVYFSANRNNAIYRVRPNR